MSGRKIGFVALLAMLISSTTILAREHLIHPYFGLFGVAQGDPNQNAMAPTTVTIENGNVLLGGNPEHWVGNNPVVYTDPILNLPISGSNWMLFVNELDLGFQVPNDCVGSCGSSFWTVRKTVQDGLWKNAFIEADNNPNISPNLTLTLDTMAVPLPQNPQGQPPCKEVDFFADSNNDYNTLRVDEDGHFLPHGMVTSPSRLDQMSSLHLRFDHKLYEAEVPEESQCDPGNLESAFIAAGVGFRNTVNNDLFIYQLATFNIVVGLGINPPPMPAFLKSSCDNETIVGPYICEFITDGVEFHNNSRLSVGGPTQSYDIDILERVRDLIQGENPNDFGLAGLRDENLSHYVPELIYTGPVTFGRARIKMGIERLSLEDDLISNGHVDFCRDFGPCKPGEADCDNNGECEPGARCVHDVGANYGFGSGIDVCEMQPGAVNGSVDFCRDFGPCIEGQGDCDGDGECAPGLRCAQNVGPNYGFGSGIDVCEGNGDVDFCLLFGPCGASQGDCDGNSECQAGLECAQNVGANYGFSSGTDVCQFLNGHNDFCQLHGPCGVGEGDCDGNSECQTGLICAQDVGLNYGFGSGTDVCEVP